VRYPALALLPLLLLRAAPAAAAAEWQLKPFVGLTFGGGTTFVDVEKAAGKPNPAIGVTGLLLGDVLGVEADLGRAPGFFEAHNQRLLQGSRLTTLTGNVVVALPKRMAGYSLRPYLVAGGGLMHVAIEGRLGGLTVSSTLPTVDFGGGATGFVTDRMGLSWEVRHFSSVGGQAHGASFGNEQLSFWRATMAVAIRY
jgi:Outer membrane protein beta-barrel domain